MKLSLVVPLMNEEENVQPLLDQIVQNLSGLEYEVILVDDGSTDRTVAKVKESALKNVKLVVFNRNYGQTTAMAAGIEMAKGELIATLDGDLQNDPQDIPRMIEVLEGGDYDVVAGIRTKRKDGMFMRKIPSLIANFIIRKMTKINLKDYGCTLKVFKKDVAKNLGLYGELHRFIPVLATMHGAKITQMNVKHHERVHGVSKYGIGRTFKVISDLLLMVFMQKYKTRPIHLFGGIGVSLFGIGALINLYLLCLKLLGADIGHRPLLTLGTVLVIAGIQFITTGFLAELVMRTYYESQNKQPYLIKEIFVGQKD